MTLRLTGLILALLASQNLWAQSPRRSEDPSAGKNHAARGSAQERENFEKHLLPYEKAKLAAKKKSKGFGILSAGSAPKPDPKPTIDAAPAKGLLKAGKTSHKLPQHENRLENPLISHPDDFLVEYELDSDAQVSVTITTAEGDAVKHFSISPGAPGGQAGLNALSYWDGQDSSGKEMPLGEYKANQVIHYVGALSQEPGGAPPRVEARALTLIKE